MAQADVFQLIQDLSAGQADTATVPAFYDEVIVDLGQRELLVAVSLIQHGINVSGFESPPSTLELLGVFYDDVALARMTQRNLEALSSHWRDRVARPTAFVTDTEGDRRFKVYPEPEQPSSTFNFPNGAPFGVDFPANGVGVIHTETRRDVPVYLEVAVALLVLQKEFARESSHRDQAFSDAAGQLGNLLLSFVS